MTITGKYYDREDDKERGYRRGHIMVRTKTVF